MDVKFQEYVRGVKVKLSVEDAPMTALRALVDAFVTACSEVEAKQPQGAIGIGAKHFRDGYTEGTTYVSSPETSDEVDLEAEIQAAEETSTAEAPKKRGRPRKVAEAAEPVEATEDKETGNATETLTVDASEVTSDAGEKSEDSTSGPATTGTIISTVTTDASPSDEEPVTDTELQRFSARIAQHFGNPQKVFDLAGQFVPEGAVPRPTNIRDAAARWAFIRAAEAASGLKYHG